jgi:hypothetical protein
MALSFGVTPLSVKIYLRFKREQLESSLAKVDVTPANNSSRS